MMKSFVLIAALWLTAVSAFTTPTALRLHHIALKPSTTSQARTHGSQVLPAPIHKTHLAASIGLPDRGNAFFREGQRMQNERRRQTRGRNILRFLYAVTTGLCIQMIMEVLISPAAWLWPAHVVQANHVLLGGALWAALIPFQLHPTFRNTHPKTHKAMRFPLLAAIGSMAYGIHNIVRQGMLFDNFLPNALQKVPWMSIWFVYAAVTAFQHARCGEYESQQRWMCRHVGAGVWIAVQRLLGWTAAMWFIRTPVSAASQEIFFALAARVGAILTVGTAEYAVAILNRQKHGYRGETVDMLDDEE